MPKSTSLNLTLHHDGEALTADVIHPATNTVVRAASMTDLVRIIHEHGDALRPVPAGNWEALFARHRDIECREDAAQASA